MNDDFNRLVKIGAQKIHEETHITKEHVQAVLHESFENLTKVQFVGFVSILEREYDINLDELKIKGLEYFADTLVTPPQKNKVFVAPKKKKNFSIFYIIVGVILFIGVVYFSLSLSSDVTNHNKIEQKLDNKVIENAKMNIETQIESNVTTDEINSTKVVDVNDTQDSVVQEKIESFVILPKTKVWLGYIEIETNKKHQTVFKDRLEIDPTKNWLLLFGHGNVEIELNGKIQKFKTRQNLRLKYVDGNLTKIDVEEFKDLNRGNKW